MLDVRPCRMGGGGGAGAFFRLTMLGLASALLASSKDLLTNVCREKYFWKSDWETLTTCWKPQGWEMSILFGLLLGLCGFFCGTLSR